MSGEIFDGVLPFPVRIVVGWAQNAGPALFGAFVVAVNIVHSHHHRMGNVDAAR